MTTMHFVFLKFGPNRAQAGQWMAPHAAWIQQGIDDGVFLMAGSLAQAQGGALLVINLNAEGVQRRVALDPFVEHEIVTPEIHAVTPSRVAPQMSALLEGSRSIAASP
jgi:uncharacterized protein YciI